MSYTVEYANQECEDAHRDEEPFDYEIAAAEQARIHNGLCPYFHTPGRCATVEEEPGRSEENAVREVSGA
jgi:hypothetical protein